MNLTRFLSFTFKNSRFNHLIIQSWMISLILSKEFFQNEFIKRILINNSCFVHSWQLKWILIQNKNETELLSFYIEILYREYSILLYTVTVLKVVFILKLTLFWEHFSFPKYPVTLSLQNLIPCHKKQTQHQIIAFFRELQLYNQGKYNDDSFTIVTTVARPYYWRFWWFDLIDIELRCSISIQTDIRWHSYYDHSIIVVPTNSKIQYSRYWAFLRNIDLIQSPSTQLLWPRYHCITDVIRIWIWSILCDFAQYWFCLNVLITLSLATTIEWRWR